WYTSIQDPAVFTIMPSEPAFFLERAPGVKGLGINLAAPVKIVRVGDCNQTGLQLNVKRPAGKVKPGLIEIIGLFVWSGHPDHHWSCVGNYAKTLFTLAQTGFGHLTIGDVVQNTNDSINSVPAFNRIVRG